MRNVPVPVLAILLSAQVLGAQTAEGDPYGIANLRVGGSFSDVVNQLHPESYVCTYTMDDPLPSCGLFDVAVRGLGEFGRVDSARLTVDRAGVVLFAYFTQASANPQTLAAKRAAIAGVWGSPDTTSEACSRWGNFPDERASMCLVEEGRPRLSLWMMASEQRIDEARRSASNTLETSPMRRDPGVSYTYFPDWRPYWIGDLRAGMHYSVFAAELHPQYSGTCQARERSVASSDRVEQWCTWSGPAGISIGGESAWKINASVDAKTDRIGHFQLLIGRYTREAHAIAAASKIAAELSSTWGEPQRRTDSDFEWVRTPFYAGVGTGWDDGEPDKPWYIMVHTYVVGEGQERDQADVGSTIGSR